MAAEASVTAAPQARSPWHQHAFINTSQASKLYDYELLN
jgi:hypothetical protein